MHGPINLRNSHMSRPLSSVLLELVYRSCPAGTTLVTMSPVWHTVLKKNLIIILPVFSAVFVGFRANSIHETNTDTVMPCNSTHQWMTYCCFRTNCCHHCPVRVTFGIRDLHVMLLDMGVFRENRQREGRWSHSGSGSCWDEINSLTLDMIPFPQMPSR